VWGFYIKLLVGVAGLAILVHFGAIDPSVLMQGMERPGLLAIATGCLLATVPLAAARWWMLLNGLSFRVGFGWSLKTTFISLFFHTFLPGAYGGDFVRVAIAYRVTRSGLNRVVFSVLTDRLTGLIALLLLSFAVVPFLPRVYAERVEIVAAVALVCGVIGLAVLLFAGDAFKAQLAHLPGAVGRTLAHICGEMLMALRAFLARPMVLVAAILLSVIQYAFVLAAMIVLGKAMHFDGLSLAGYVIAGTWSLVANAIPLTPGGLGIGEAAFGRLASLLAAGGTGYGTVFLAMRVLSIGVGVLGVLPWLLSRSDLKSGITAVRRAEMAERSAEAAE
jgi:uncharacterized protein (TIRG00374 family)